MASIRKTKKQGKKYLSTLQRPFTPQTKGFRYKQPWAGVTFCEVYTEKSLLRTLREMMWLINRRKRIRLENLKRKKQ